MCGTVKLLVNIAQSSQTLLALVSVSGPRDDIPTTLQLYQNVSTNLMYGVSLHGGYIVVDCNIVYVFGSCVCRQQSRDNRVVRSSHYARYQYLWVYDPSYLNFSTR